MQEIEMGGSSVAIAAVQDAIARGMLASFLSDRLLQPVVIQMLARQMHS